MEENKEFLDRYKVTEYRNNIELIESKETGNVFFVENKNGYYTVYINYDPVSKKVTLLKDRLSPDIAILQPIEDPKNFIQNVDKPKVNTERTGSQQQ